MNSDGYMDPIFISEAQFNGANAFDQKINPVCTKNLNPHIIVMKPAKDRA
jgi:hypothetical protein